MGDRPRCRRCLLEDMPSEREIAQVIREQIELMAPQLRADASERTRRLSICRECDHLISGMCGLCGCYVELRTAKRRMRCPDVPPRWARQEE